MSQGGFCQISGELTACSFFAISEFSYNTQAGRVAQSVKDNSQQQLLTGRLSKTPHAVTIINGRIVRQQSDVLFASINYLCPIPSPGVNDANGVALAE